MGYGIADVVLSGASPLILARSELETALSLAEEALSSARNSVSDEDLEAALSQAEEALALLIPVSESDDPAYEEYQDAVSAQQAAQEAVNVRYVLKGEVTVAQGAVDARDALIGDVTAAEVALDADIKKNGETDELLLTGPSYADDIVTTAVGSPAGAGGAQVGSAPVIVNGTEADSDAREALGELQIGTDADIVNGNEEGAGSIAVGTVPVVENGAVEGLNAEQVGADATIVNGNVAGINPEQVGADPVIVNGSEEGEGAAQVAPVTVVNGSEAVEAAAWTATLDLDFAGELTEAYTFSLTLTEVLGEDAAADAVAAEFTFSLEAEAGATAAEVLEQMAALVDADAGFAASVIEGQVVVSAVDFDANYSVDTAVELVGVVTEDAAVFF